MKQTRFWLTTIAALLCSLTANAYDFEVDGIYYNITSDTDLTVEVSYKGNSYSEYNEYTGNIIIPSVVIYNGKEYIVTRIGSSAFHDCTSLTSITIPKEIVSIGNYAFNGCSHLKEVIFEDGNATLSLGYNYKSIYAGKGKGLFYDCPLQTLYLGRNLKYSYSSEYDYTPFLNSSELAVVSIGDSVTYLESGIFKGCVSLTSIVIPESVTRVEGGAFAECGSLVSITIPKSVVELSQAFNGCTSLTDIIIEDGEETLELASHYMFPNSPLKTLYLGRNLNFNSQISDTPFSKTTLETITIGEKVTEIPDNTFRGCERLRKLHLKDGEEVLVVGHNSAFVGNSDGFGGVFVDSPLTEVYLGRNIDYSNSSYDSPFAGKERLKTVTIGNKVTSIADMAFYGCKQLSEFDLPGGVVSIGAWAFAYCSSLASITIPEKSILASIENHAFAACNSLTSIAIPREVTNIGNYAFSECACLDNLMVYMTSPLTISSNTFHTIDISADTLHVPQGTKALYEAAEVWKDFGEIVEMEPEYTLGDPNNDGYIDVADLAGVARFVLGTAGSDLKMEAADMDGNGIVEVNDYVALVNLILKQSNTTTRNAVTR